jgi:hypothetical protein
MSRPAPLTRWLLIGLMLGCGQAGGRPGLRLEASRVESNTRLTLIPDAGLKISARLPPALEFSDGSVLRFTSLRLTPDSAYFAEPPAAWLRGRPREVHGTLHASVCDAGAAVCRSVVIRL